IGSNESTFIPPLPIAEARKRSLQKTDNTPSLPSIAPLPDRLEIPVLLVVGDNVSTDDIIPAGGRVLPYWSNVYETAKFAFEPLDPTYYERASKQRDEGGHAIVGGKNYGQGSSRENAALVPALLGLRVVIACGFARIHWQNLISFGVLPLVFENAEDYKAMEAGGMLTIDRVHEQLAAGAAVHAATSNPALPNLRLRHALSARQLKILKAGGVINQLRPTGNR
ncbi:MAG TPA: hypothetical protein VNQ97_10510, partial [Burkholderiaceae bacterium]|nr:hypothetical protein [Burkholderiaceae bacterium]